MLTRGNEEGNELSSFELGRNAVHLALLFGQLNIVLRILNALSGKRAMVQQHINCILVGRELCSLNCTTIEKTKLHNSDNERHLPSSGRGMIASTALQSRFTYRNVLPVMLSTSVAASAT
jgi:hypothetical protein